MYCQSTYFPVWGCYFSLYFTVLSEYLPSCLRMSLFFVFHCYESPDVLAKYLQSAWGVTSVSAARCLLMYCQSTINLPGGVTPAFCWFWTELSWSCTWAGEQQSPGYKFCCQVLPIYCQSTFDSSGEVTFCFHCQVSLIVLSSTFSLFPSISWGLLPDFFQGVTSVCQTY